MAEHEFLQFPAEAVTLDPALYDPLPASARRVFEAVKENGPLTHTQLAAITGLPARTIRYAVKRLKDRQIIDSRCSLRDCRTCYFFVHPRHINPAALEDARRRAEDAMKAGRLVERLREPTRRPSSHPIHARPSALPVPAPAPAVPAVPTLPETISRPDSSQ